MKISEFIDNLLYVKSKVGDTNVWIFDYDSGWREAIIIDIYKEGGKEGQPQEGDIILNF